MKHFIKTKYGISNEFIQTSTTLIFVGSEQGNGDGPILCHSRMESLSIAYAKGDHGFNFKDPTEEHKFLQWIVRYVENNSKLLTSRQ